MPRALITGVNGFVGPYLVEHLHSLGYEVTGLDMGEKTSLSGVAYSAADILDGAVLKRAVAAARPDEIYHLAGISYLPEADATPVIALKINILGTALVLDAVREAAPAARTLVVGTSKEYDNTATADGIEETAHPGPTDFYGVTKYAAELVGRQYVRQFGLDVRFTRSFNHTGPGQPPKFVCSDWARQAALIARGLARPRIAVGNLDAEIDFLDVRDVVRAYRAILAKGRAGEVYNVCTGCCTALRTVLDYLIRKSGKRVEVAADEHKLRGHVTSRRMTGDNRKLTDATGWKPLIPLEKTLDDLFDYWMAREKKQGIE